MCLDCSDIEKKHYFIITEKYLPGMILFLHSMPNMLDAQTQKPSLCSLLY